MYDLILNRSGLSNILVIITQKIVEKPNYSKGKTYIICTCYYHAQYFLENYVCFFEHVHMMVKAGNYR